jgi:chemotaxis protein CheY-P-specific phosphatase CheC
MRPDDCETRPTASAKPAELHPDGLERLLELAMLNSIEKLSAMLEVPIRLENREVVALEPGVCLSTQEGDAPCCSVIFGVRGESHGALFLELTEAAAAAICELAPEGLRQYLPEEAERNRALLEELGNLVASTYLDVFSDFSGLRMLPTAPDYAEGTSLQLRARFLAALQVEPRPTRVLKGSLAIGSGPTTMLVASCFPDKVVAHVLAGARDHCPHLFFV